VGIRLAGDSALTAALDPPFLRRTGTGVTVELRVQPRARRTALEVDAAGVLKSSVTAPPEDGKANAAVIELLAREWRLPKSVFDVKRGAAARNKAVSVAGESAELAARIGDWLRQGARGHG
jgi:uncharacterized protein YggU (UPF0235/DUF167 family)